MQIDFPEHLVNVHGFVAQVLRKLSFDELPPKSNLKESVLSCHVSPGIQRRLIGWSPYFRYVISSSLNINGLALELQLAHEVLLHEHENSHGEQKDYDDEPDHHRFD